MADYYINKTAARIDYLLEKVEGIEDGAEVNQNAISFVTANGVTIASSSKTDSIEVAAGSNVTVAADASNKTLTISAVDTTYSDATTSVSGLMSAADKTKLDTIESGAEVNVQSDWNQTNTGSDDYIKNKPTLGAAAAKNVDTYPTIYSSKLVESGGVASALNCTWRLSGAMALVDGKDLNNLTLPGTYFHDASGIDTLSNIPEQVAFRLYVGVETDSYRHVEQIFNPISSYKEYRRYYISNTWSNWKVVNDDLSQYQATLVVGENLDNVPTSGSINPITSGAVCDKFVTVDANIDALRLMMDATVYGFRIDKQDSNPETRVEYLYDAVGMTPARMNYTTGQFDYGSWANAWFITGNKPCALLYNGTVDYYLDPDDYTKKADGTASDVSDSSYAGNFMASIPAVWIKRWEDERYQYVAIASRQISDEFKAYAHDAGDGFINDMIYLPMFKGVIVDSKLRSIAGVTPQVNTTGSEEKTAAETCGTGWQILDWAKHELISDLLTLISRSTDSQTAFGQGDTNTYDETDTTTYGMLTTGTSGAGQFYGTNDKTHHVKVFHIEDFWGNRSDTCLGLNVLNKQFSYKMVRPYALSPDSSYVSSGFDVPDSGYQIQNYIGEFGNLPKTTGGSATTYICDSYYGLTTNDNRLAFIGGACNRGDESGSRYLTQRIVNYSYTLIGGSPCYNAPHSA